MIVCIVIVLLAGTLGVLIGTLFASRVRERQVEDFRARLKFLGDDEFLESYG